MLLSQKSIVILNSNNVKYYEEKGYNIPRRKDKKGKFVVPKGTKIIVKTIDLSKGSHVKIDYICDYCNEKHTISYKDYLKNHDDELGDCCHKCEGVKYKHTMEKRYGVKNAIEIPGVIEKIKETNRKKYSYDYHMQRKEYQEHYEKTMLERYGVKRPLQYEEFKIKMISTWSKNQTTPTSKPQLKIFNILCNLYPDCCKLEMAYDQCLLDCVIEKDGIKIDVEYDGWYWHQDEEKDKRRDYFLLNRGYRILRIKGNKKDEIPFEKEIKKSVDILLYTEKEKIIITM